MIETGKLLLDTLTRKFYYFTYVFPINKNSSPCLKTM